MGEGSGGIGSKLPRKECCQHFDGSVMFYMGGVVQFREL